MYVTYSEQSIEQNVNIYSAEHWWIVNERNPSTF